MTCKDCCGVRDEVVEEGWSAKGVHRVNPRWISSHLDHALIHTVGRSLTVISWPCRDRTGKQSATRRHDTDLACSLQQ